MLVTVSGFPVVCEKVAFGKVGGKDVSWGKDVVGGGNGARGKVSIPDGGGTKVVMNTMDLEAVMSMVVDDKQSKVL